MSRQVQARFGTGRGPEPAQGYRGGVATTDPASPRPDPAELTWRFDTSGGPGGQHANRSATRVECSFDIRGSRSLTEAQRQRLLARFGDTVVAAADDTRSQWRNRNIAYERLCERLDSAFQDAPQRVATRRTRSSQRRRLDTKRRRGQTKDLRRRPRSTD